MSVSIRQYWRDDNTLMLVRSAVPNLVARYGESPSRVLGTVTLYRAWRAGLPEDRRTDW